MRNLIGLVLFIHCFIAFNATAQIQKGQNINGLSSNSYMGWSLNMPHKNILAVGEPLSDIGATDAGVARVYRWDGSSWVQKGNDIIGEAASDWSGTAVQMPDTNTIAVGSFLNDGNGNNAGHVRIFVFNGTNWVQKGADIDGEAAEDRSGTTLWMSDSNHIIIGAALNDGNGGDAGHARVFEWNGTQWVQMGADIDGEVAGDQAGTAVAFPENKTIAISARYNDGGGTDVGQVKIYRWNGTNWIQKGTSIYGETAGDVCGNAIAMPDTNTIAIGSVYNDGGAFDGGHARVFHWNGTNWVQKGNDIDGLIKDNYAGWAVAMPDANTIAVGMPYNDLKSYRSGSVMVYAWKNNKWVQNGSNINGNGSSDFCGRAVHMCDANTVAVGSPYRDAFGTDRGEARVFELCSDFGSAIKFDGINDYIDVGVNSITQQTGTFTIECRVKIDTLIKGFQAFVGNYIDSVNHTRGYWMGTGTSGKAIWFIGNNSSLGYNLVSNRRIDDGEWHLLSGTFSGDSIHLYIDGQYDNKMSTPNAYLKSDTALWLGNDVYNEAFNGKLDDVRIWNKVRTATEIDAVKNGCLSGTESNLVAYYQFDVFQNTSLIKNFAGNNTHGVLKNADTNLVWNSGTCCYKCDFNINKSATSLTKKSCIKYTSPSGKYVWTSTGLFKDTLTNAIGCDSVISVNLTINNPTSSNNIVSACFKYKSPSGKYNWTKSGVYKDTILNASGCDSMITFQLSIDTVDIMVTNNSPKLIAQASAASYQWLDCKNNYSKIAGATNASYTATAIGNYAVEIVQKGCIDTSDCLIVKTLSVNENSIDQSVLYYTNPSSDWCLIQLSDKQEQVVVSVKNELGADVAAVKFNHTNQLKIQLPETAGIYFIQISSESIKTTLKVLKQ